MNASQRKQLKTFFALCVVSAYALGCNPSQQPSRMATPEKKMSAIPKSPSIDQVRKIMAALLGISQDKLTDSTSLQDLGADELDFVELIMELEETFDITITEERAEKLAGFSKKSGLKGATVERIAAMVDELSGNSLAK